MKNLTGQNICIWYLQSWNAEIIFIIKYKRYMYVLRKLRIELLYTLRVKFLKCVARIKGRKN